MSDIKTLADIVTASAQTQAREALAAALTAFESAVDAVTGGSPFVVPLTAMDRNGKAVDVALGFGALTTQLAYVLRTNDDILSGAVAQAHADFVAKVDQGMTSDASIVSAATAAAAATPATP